MNKFNQKDTVSDYLFLAALVLLIAASYKELF